MRQRGLFLLVAVAVISLNLENVRRVRDSMEPPFLYWKDCGQPFLMGNAILHGTDPYTPLPKLAKQWLPSSSPADHPTPYPPFAGLLGLPLAFFDYVTAAHMWLASEILFLLGSVLLICKAIGFRPGVLGWPALVGLLFVWRPVSDELRQGQFMSMLLVLLAAAWLSLRESRDRLGGFFLGLLISIKLIAWPMVLFLMMVKRWVAVRWAALCIGGAHLLALPTVGLAGLVNYYIHVGPFNAKLWRPAEGNYSTFAWATRLFDGVGFSFVIEPLWKAPTVASLTTYLFPSIVLVAGLWIARKAKSFDTAFSILIGVSLLVSPIVWHFYLILLLIPIAILAERLIMSVHSAERRVLALAFLGFMSVAPDTYEGLARSFGHKPAETSMLVVPFWPSLFQLIPVAAFLGVLWLIWRTDDAQTG